jgi:hypothetical protein
MPDYLFLMHDDGFGAAAREPPISRFEALRGPAEPGRVFVKA